MSHRFRTFGGRLKELMDERSISLEELAKATKIRKVILEAIFKGQREQLPDDIFVVGFLRAMLNCLDVSPDPWIEEFKALSKPEDTEKMDIRQKALTPVPEISSKSHFFLWLLLVLSIVACSGLYLFRFSLRDLKERLFAGGESAAAVITDNQKPGKRSPLSEEKAETGMNQAQKQPAESSPPLSDNAIKPEPQARNAGKKEGLEIIVRSLCWIELYGNNNERLLKREASPGETLHFAGKAFRISVGDSSALDILYDGMPVDFEKAKGKVIRNLAIGGEQK
jgi:cytoskeletal protein RodZ